MEGFDFSLTNDGDLYKTEEDIRICSGNEWRYQTAGATIKSISHNWYVDEIGSNLEELIGHPIDEILLEKGRKKILTSLLENGLFEEKDILIIYEMKTLNRADYSVYLRFFEPEEIVKSIGVQLDLVKGVELRMGW